jgi:hypothetical protein
MGMDLVRPSTLHGGEDTCDGLRSIHRDLNKECHFGHTLGQITIDGGDDGLILLDPCGVSQVLQHQTAIIGSGDGDRSKRTQQRAVDIVFGDFLKDPIYFGFNSTE